MRFRFWVILIILSGAAWAQKSVDTILKMQTEQDLAARLESQLSPFIGKSVVLIDLELEYPSNRVQAFGMDLDEQESLPGLPVSRSTTAVIPQGTEKHNQVKVLSKKITVYVSKSTKQEVISFVEKQISSWYDITEENSNTLEISPILDPVKQKSSQGSIILFGILLTILLFMLMINLKSALLYLAKAVKSTNITGFDKPLQVKGNMGSNLPAGFQSQSPFRLNDNKPVPIKIIPDSVELTDDADFSYLEELSMDSFHQLVMACSEANVSFMLSNLSPIFLKDFYLEYPNLADYLLPLMLNSLSKTKPQIREIQKEVNSLYQKFNEEAKVESDGSAALIKLLNNLPYNDSEKLLNDIINTDPAKGKEIRSHLFLLDDILKLDDDVVEEIYRNINHDLLVGFLASVENNIRIKILNSMTPRAQMILEEDIHILGKLSEEDRNMAIFEMLQTIRTKLNY